MEGMFSKTLTATSLLSIFLMTLHSTDEVLRNEFGSLQGLVTAALVLILIVWLYGISLVLRERRGGYIISLVISLYISSIALAHMTGDGDVSLSQIAAATGPFFVWVVIALGVTSISSLVLSIYGLRGAGRASGG